MHRRFGVSDIPDAYLFFPTELGGLDLRSPFISIMPVRGTVAAADPARTLLDAFFDAERDAYAARKAAFERRRQNHPQHPHHPQPGVQQQRWEPETDRDRDTFMGFAEFARYREDLAYAFDGDLARVYERLLEQPLEEGIAGPGPALASGIQALDSGAGGGFGGGATGGGGIHGSWEAMEPYWKWVARLYGPEAMDRFGGLTIVEPGLLPMGMVSIFRDKRVKWQG
ncbi:hypothetical protein F4809DRAFT_596447 [Biscogniauxia mediterranea]|nr:hypothetical protein F4809DRAFT_596447 [Biscogniauxia mediterranea]